jgi:hypothetical protein
MKKKIESYLPIFPGFYGTIFESDSEECEIQHYNQENDTELEYDDFTWYYRDYEENMSRECCFVIQDKLEELDLDIKVTFQKLVSPKYYNFKNDSINVEYEVTQHDYDKVIHYIKRNWSQFEEYIKSKYSSCDGFISSHSNNPEVWMNNMKSESHLEHNFGSVLEFILTNEEFTQNDLIYSITDVCLSYEVIDQGTCRNGKEWSKCDCC